MVYISTTFAPDQTKLSAVLSLCEKHNIDRSNDTLDSIKEFDRTRGYPTAQEWRDLLEKIKRVNGPL